LPSFAFEKPPNIEGANVILTSPEPSGVTGEHATHQREFITRLGGALDGAQRGKKVGEGGLNTLYLSRHAPLWD
jgi:hypothetical protein